MYERYLGPYIFEPYAEDIVSRIPSTDIHTALEVACGTGRVTGKLRKALPGGCRLVASDLNPDMIAEAQKHIPDNEIEWLAADAQSLPFVDNYFDLLVCQFGLMFVPNKPLAVSEAFRVLKPGGTLLLSTWDKLENNPAMFLAHQTVASFFPADPPMFFHVPFSLFDMGMLESLCKDAGFSNIATNLVKKTGMSPSAGETVTGMIDGSAVANAINERDATIMPVIKQTLETALAKAFGNAPMASPLQAWVLTAQK
jgi:ubiquinone/menaquinone biosynthesis C-methylase UbiE